MPENPHDKEDLEKETAEEVQKQRSYYYDDAHGYEVYAPDDDEEEEKGSEGEEEILNSELKQ